MKICFQCKSINMQQRLDIKITKEKSKFKKIFKLGSKKGKRLKKKNKQKNC